MEGGSQTPVLAGARGERLAAAAARPRRARFARFHRPARLSCALFLLVIAAALPLGLLRSQQSFRLAENRLKSPSPVLKQLFIDPKGFVERYESYVADRLALRHLLIGAVGTIKWTLGVGGKSHLMVGRDGWLFICSDPCLEDIRGTAPPRPAIVRSWTAPLDSLRQFAEARGARMTTMVVPRKEAVYDELLPAWTRGGGRETHAGHFLAAARASGLDAIYPLEELRAQKSAGKLYYRYDHHFTRLGSLEATGILLRHLHERY